MLKEPANQTPRVVSSLNIDTNGLGNVVMEINGQELHLSAFEADNMANMLHQKAKDASWQSTVSG